MVETVKMQDPQVDLDAKKHLRSLDRCIRMQKGAVERSRVAARKVVDTMLLRQKRLDELLAERAALIQ
jgi:hypothetical protein